MDRDKPWDLEDAEMEDADDDDTEVPLVDDKNVGHTPFVSESLPDWDMPLSQNHLLQHTPLIEEGLFVEWNGLKRSQGLWNVPYPTNVMSKLQQHCSIFRQRER